MANRNIRKAIAVSEGERLWQTYGLSSPDDLVLEDVAYARGVIVTEGPLDKMEARLIRHAGRGLIRVKGGLPEAGRRRFAIAHELGHWELHEGVSQLFACTSEDMVATYKASPLEAEANYFASGLLMPEFLFSKATDGKEFSFETLSGLGSTFGTSLTATGIRYVEGSDDYVAIVASENSCVRWWRGSSCFEERFWIDCRSRLSPGTVAASLASSAGPTRTSGPEEVDIDAWSEGGSQNGCDTFVEESMYLSRYTQVLSLLRLS